MNHCMIAGYMGDDPESKMLASGDLVCNITVATQRNKDITDWHRVILWKKQAEFADAYLKKGSYVVIEGEIRYRNYENKVGQTVYVTEINAYRIESPKQKAQPSIPAEEFVKAADTLADNGIFSGISVENGIPPIPAEASRYRSKKDGTTYDDDISFQ